MKRLFLSIILLTCLLTSLAANPVLSSAEQKAIDELLEYRIYAATLPFNEAVNALTEYKTKNNTDAKTFGFSEETSLILDALVNLDILPLYQANNSVDPKIQQIAETQFDRLEGWIDSHEDETPNKWTYCLAAEAFDWYLAYLPVTQILAKGLLPKQYYQKALEQDPDMSYALCGLAQWQYYAPSIGGGGTKVARSSLEKAVKNAKTDADKFISHLFYSQVLFELKDKKGAEKELAAAEAVSPDNRRLARFRQMNEAGFSWFEFARDFEENRAKLRAPLVN